MLRIARMVREPDEGPVPGFQVFSAPDAGSGDVQDQLLPPIDVARVAVRLGYDAPRNVDGVLEHVAHEVGHGHTQSLGKSLDLVFEPRRDPRVEHPLLSLFLAHGDICNTP